VQGQKENWPGGTRPLIVIVKRQIPSLRGGFRRRDQEHIHRKQPSSPFDGKGSAPGKKEESKQKVQGGKKL